MCSNVELASVSSATSSLSHLSSILRSLLLYEHSFYLEQIVTFPTRGDRMLDLVLINLEEYGLLDHMSIEVQPKDISQLSNSRLTMKTRDLKPSNRLAMQNYHQEVDVHTLVGNAHGCAEKVSTFQSII